MFFGNNMEWTLETSYRENKTLFCYPGSHLFPCLQKALLILLHLVPRESGLQSKLFSTLSDWPSGLSSSRSSAGPRECPEFVTSALTALSSGCNSPWLTCRPQEEPLGWVVKLVVSEHFSTSSQGLKRGQLCHF